jgi:hypothetical protein
VSSDYGALAQVVSASGSIIAAIGAIGLAWRGRTRWEPSEEDVPSGGQKVGALVAASLIVLIWTEMRDPTRTGQLNLIIVITAVATLVLFLGYSFLVGRQTYQLYPGMTEEKQVIGGFRLTVKTRKVKDEKQVDDKTLLRGFADEVESVWTRGSRQAAKTVCITLYTLFLVCGTVALAATAVRIGIALQRFPMKQKSRRVELVRLHDRQGHQTPAS